MVDNTAIEVNNLSKVYKLYNKPMDRLKETIHPFRKSYHQEFYALQNVSFTVDKGETVGIIGKNGSGKSTLLKILTGIITPSQGEIRVNGKVAALLELGAGFNPDFSGIENIYLNGTIMGYSKTDMDSRLDDILAFADIGNFVNQPVKMYSSGMFARLAFALYSNVDPEVLIVDEALSVGDMFFQAKCMMRLKQMMENGTTILFVSHDLGAVKSLCTKALWLKNGKTVRFGSADTVVSNYAKDLISDVSNQNYTIRCVNEKKVSGVHVKSTDFPADDSFNGKENLRAGTGLAKFHKVDVFDTNGEPLNNKAYYDQEITIKAYIQFYGECENIAIAYHIRNKQRQEIVGNDTMLANTDIYERVWYPQDKLIIKFKTRLPIIQGNYSINLLISTFKDKSMFTDVAFHDWIENAYIFEVQTREPFPIWDFVYLENEVSYEQF